MEVSGQFHALATLPPRERACDSQWIGAWVGSRASLNAVAKGRTPSPARNHSVA